MGCNCENGDCDHAELLLGKLDKITDLLGITAEVLSAKRYRPSGMAVEDGSGHATVLIPTQGGVNNLWLLERISWGVNVAAMTGFGVFVMEGKPPATNVDLDELNLVESSTLLRGTINESSAPILVKGGENIMVQGRGVTAGGILKVRLQLRQAWQSPD